jgi:DNA polymerase III alpha subunit
MRTQKIISVKKIGKKTTLDLEVNHPDHNFYAEGFVTSNSHSYSYASLSAITVYIKFKYPQQFFISLLKMSKYEQKPHEEVRIVSSELPAFGIKLLPPDLIKSKMDFSIDGADIRYGLSSIKGVSDKSIEALLSFRDSKPQDKFEFFLTAKEAGLNIGVLSALIQAGAIGGYKQKRSRMVLEAQCFNLLTEREKRNMIIFGAQNDFDLLNMIKKFADEETVGDDMKKIISKSRFETIKKHIAPYKEIYEKNSKYESFANWYFENHFLGYSSSEKLKLIMGDDFCDSSDKDEIHPFEKRKFVGVVLNSKKAKSGNNNSYLLLQTKDESGELKFLFCDSPRNKKFTKFCEEGGKIPEKEDIVVVYGGKSEDGQTIFVDDLHILTEKIYINLKDLKG